MGFLYHQQNEFAMPRLMLNDEFWSKLEKILLQEAIYNKRNLRMTVEGMLLSNANWLPVARFTEGFRLLEFHLQKIQCMETFAR